MKGGLTFPFDYIFCFEFAANLLQRQIMMSLFVRHPNGYGMWLLHHDASDHKVIYWKRMEVMVCFKENANFEEPPKDSCKDR